MTRTIHRAARRHRYVIVDQAAVADTRLSWAARGLLAYLLPRPDDWKVLVNDRNIRCNDLPCRQVPDRRPDERSASSEFAFDAKSIKQNAGRCTVDNHALTLITGAYHESVFGIRPLRDRISQGTTGVGLTAA